MKDSSITFLNASLVYSGSIPGGDLDDRFGFTNQIGGEMGVKFSNGWFFRAGARFLFGNSVRERVAENVTTLIGSEESGFSTMALGSDGRFYQIRFWERGIVVPVTVGKVLRVLKGNSPNSGLYVEAGAQFIQHKILMEVVGNSVPYLDNEHRKGYDRLSNGLGVIQGVGYRFYSKRRTVNFHIGLECSQNFTRSRRSFNYDTGTVDNQARLDLLFGIKAGWTFPIYKAAPEDEYYY